MLHQTVSTLPVANQVFLGSWMVDICQECRSQRSAPQRRHTARLKWRSHDTPRTSTQDTAHLGQCACQAPGHVSSWGLGKVQNACLMESVPLWTTRELEPEQLRPGSAHNPGPLWTVPLQGTLEPELHKPGSTHAWAGADPVWFICCKHSPHMPVILVCSVPPPHRTAEQVSLNK